MSDSVVADLPRRTKGERLMKRGSRAGFERFSHGPKADLGRGASQNFTYRELLELTTYVTLRIYDLDPAEISTILGVEPTSIQQIGAPIKRPGKSARRSGWFLTTYD
jgi:hypothetical protein